MDSSFKALQDTIIEKKELTPEIEEEIKKIIGEVLVELK